MLLPTSPRDGVGVLLCVCAHWLLFSGVCASSSGKAHCPHLVCANEKRHFCKTGSSHCGSCLSPLVENKEGLCVAKHKHMHRNGQKTFPGLEEEIDFLHSVIEEKEVTVVQPKRPKVQVNTSSQKVIFLDAVVPNQSAEGRLAAASPNVINTTASPLPPPPLAPEESSTPAPQPSTTAVDGRAGPVVVPVPNHISDNLIIILISLCIVVGTVFMIIAAICYFRLRKGSRLAQKVAYPAFRGPGASAVTVNGTSLGDKTLAQSAQMYHYQHHKQQMMSMEKRKSEQKVDSELTSDEEEIGGDMTVYECPGLAPTGEMEVKNPLFDDSTLQYQGDHQ